MTLHIGTPLVRGLQTRATPGLQGSELYNVHNPSLCRAQLVGLVAFAGDVAIDDHGATQGGMGAACS